MIILVDGLPASGKAILKGLLDGHSKVFAGYNHDMIADALCDYHDDKWLFYKDIQYLRSLLATTQYYQLEQYSYRKATVISMTSEENNRYSVNFDFYKMDSTMMETLQNQSEWTVEGIAYAIFHSLMYSGDYPENKQEIEHFVSMGFNRPDICEKFIERYPTGKILYMVRSLEQIIGVLTNRVPHDDDMWSLILNETTVSKLIKEGFVEKLRNSLSYIYEMESKFPNRIKIVDFEELILNTEVSMRSIAAWLDIPYESSLERCTMGGIEMVTDTGKSVLGEILDPVEKTLTHSERALINFELNPLSFFKPFNHKYWKEFSFIIFSKINRKIKNIKKYITTIINKDLKEVYQTKWQRNGFW